MTANIPGASLNEILAAGGIVRDSATHPGKIAVVRRRRYGGELALPKGKVKEEKGEDILKTALREVEEETGCKTTILGYAGTTHYFDRGRPKAVCYYLMEVAGDCSGGPHDTNEIEAVEWLSPEEAVRALTHTEDRDLVAAVFGLPRRPPP